MTVTRRYNPVGVTSRGPRPDDYDFSLALTPRNDFAVPPGTYAVQKQDTIYSESLPSGTIDHAFDIAITGEVHPERFTKLITNLTPGVVNIAGTSATRLADGTAEIRVETPWLRRRAAFDVYRESPGLVDTFAQFAPGSLARFNFDLINSRLAGLTRSDANTLYYNADFTLNPSCWAAGLDFSFVFGPKNTFNPINFITPQHTVTANHTGQPWLGAGGTWSLCARDGSEYLWTSTVTHVVTLDTDLRLCRWSNPLPGDAPITIPRVLPYPAAAWCPSVGQNGFPAIRWGRTNNGSGPRTVGTIMGKLFDSSFVYGTQATRPASTSQTDVFFAAYAGTSGSPMVIFDDEGPILLGCSYGTIGQDLLSPGLAFYRSTIDAQIAAWGDPQRVAVASLANFPTY